MKTPYDDAMRAIGREVEDLRRAIGSVTQQLTEVDRASRSIGDALAAERGANGAAHHPSNQAWFERMRERRGVLRHDRAGIDAELQRLRLHAIDRYGSLRAVEGAAADWRERTDRALASAEQAQLDDVAGTRTMRDARARAGGRSIPSRAGRAR